MASTYLTRSISGSSGNQKKWTFSGWFKRSYIGTEQRLLTSSDNSSYDDNIRFNSDNTIEMTFNNSVVLKTNGVFRDPSFYYHIVVKVDTDQASANDRIVLYINGVDERTVGGYSTGSMPNQGVTGYINYNAFYIGVTNPSANSKHFNGIMSHVHFTDAYAYTASSFGETDSTTGEWKINVAPSVTYGSNGFWILKDGNSVTDSSTNSNTFTISAGNLTKTEDNPSNVFATINPLVGSNLMGSTVIFGNGNTNVQDPSGSASGINPQFISTLGMPSKGKFYCELKPNSFSTSSGHGIGIFRTSSGNTADVTSSSNQIRYIFADTSIYISKYGSTDQSGLTAISSGDIVGMALDLDNGTLQYYVNGVARGNQITGVSSANDGYDYFFFANLESSSSGRYGRYYWNFGNGYFATTAVSSAGTNASGIGIFEYDVPANFTALSTKGLNL